MNIIVFTNMLEGHHLEYIHHLYDMARKLKEHHFVFLLPSSFPAVKDKMIWEPADHIQFQLYDELENTSRRFILFKLLGSSYRVSKLIGKYAKRYQADIVFTNTIIDFVPFAPVFIRKPTKLAGIIYRIYLHDMEYQSKAATMVDKLKYQVMSRFHVFYRIFILNDKESAQKLNTIYRTDKYIALPDPYVPLNTNTVFDIRKEYNIAHDKVLFVHFGALNGNKGTLEILESIKNLPMDEQGKYVFFFAGRVSDGIKAKFYEILSGIGKKTTVVVKDEFCSYEFLASLCIACDAILTPYRRTAQSSGLIGYASQFGKPVIAVSKGLLGQLVKEFGLGVLVENNSIENLQHSYRVIADGNYQKPTKRYCNQNSITSFQMTIQKSLI